MKAAHIRRVAAVAIFVAASWHLTAAAYIPLKAAVAQRLLERSWGQARAGKSAPHPWPWADTYPVARLSAPKQGADFIVLSGSSGRTLAFAPAWMEGSATPGADGLTVIAGHRDTHFAFLQSVAVSDALRLALPDGRHMEFIIRETKIVDSRRTGIDLDAPGAALMLVTCYPFDAMRAGGPLRYRVTAEPVNL